METSGTAISASRQRWLKVNTKPVRMGTLDGATFPYVIKGRYTVDGIEYVGRQWIGAGRSVPAVGSCVRLTFEQGKPAKAKLL